MSYASDIPGARPGRQAGVLDITASSYYRNFVRVEPSESNISFWGERGEFRAIFEGLGIESTSSEDGLQGIRAYGSSDGIEYDVTFNFTSPVLLNAGLGPYLVGGELGYEWSLPRGATQGWVKIDSEVVNVVPEKSFTWYDRQWGSLQDSFTWMMLHLEKADWLDVSLMALWDWKDVVNGEKKFATMRNSKTGLDSVIPLSLKTSSTNIHTLPDTGLIYPQEWVVILDDLEILVKSPRADHVFEAAPGTGFPSQFSGYMDVIAKKAGHAPVRGYGAVDLMSID
jgi:hypothetical protein